MLKDYDSNEIDNLYENVKLERLIEELCDNEANVNLFESISKETVEDIFEHTPFSKSNIETIAKFISSVNQEESSNINLNNIQSKEKVLQILNNMKNFDKIGLYKKLRNIDKSDDANKGNSDRKEIAKGIITVVGDYYETHPNELKKALVYNIRDLYFKKDTIKKFAEKTNIDIKTIKHYLKLGKDDCYLGERTIEKALQKYANK